MLLQKGSKRKSAGAPAPAPVSQPKKAKTADQAQLAGKAVASTPASGSAGEMPQLHFIDECSHDDFLGMHGGQHEQVAGHRLAWGSRLQASCADISAATLQVPWQITKRLLANT